MDPLKKMENIYAAIQGCKSLQVISPFISLQWTKSIIDKISFSVYAC